MSYWEKFSSRSNTGKNTFVNSNYSLSSNLNSENSRILGKGLFYNDVDICGNLTVGGIMSVSNLPSIITSFENLQITGNLDASGVHIENNLDVSGMDISYNLFVGGNLDVSGDFVFDNNLDVSGMDISYNLFVAGNLDVSGDVIFRDKLDVSGVDISNNLMVGRLFLESETITVGYDATISSTSAPGTVYIPEKSTVLLKCLPFWNEQQELVPNNAAVDDNFGYSVAIDGSSNDAVAIVGAYNKEVGGINQGVAYIFDKTTFDTWTQVTPMLVASNPANYDLFGHSVAISNSYLYGPVDLSAVAIVGAPNKNNGGPGQGSAYVFDNSGGTWAQVGVPLTAPDANNGAYFGWSVSITEGPRYDVIVGAPNHDHPGHTAPTTGSAYIYIKTLAGTWSFLEELLPSDGATNDEFGWSVAISGDALGTNTLAVVGAPNHTHGGIKSGAVYMYDRNSGLWGNEIKLAPSDGGSNDQYGYCVSISKTGTDAIAIVGAPKHTHGGIKSGAAYIYDRSSGTWGNEIELIPSNAQADAKFGQSVSITGTGNDAVAIIGAPDMHNAPLTDSGSAYIFHRPGGTWVEVTPILTASDAESNDEFGRSVAISGSNINDVVTIVGAPFHTHGGIKSGSAYMFGSRAGPHSDTINWNLNFDSSYQELNIFYDSAQDPYLNTQINFGTNNLGTNSGLESDYLLSKNGQSLSIMSPFSGAERQEEDGKWRVMNAPIKSAVLEKFSVFCQGQTVSTIKGNVSIGNVTANSAGVPLTETYTAVDGSIIEYTPPDGTTQVIYQFTMQLNRLSTLPLPGYAYIKFFIDDVEQTVCRNKFMNHGDECLTVTCPILIGHAAEPTRCTVPDWTSPKELRLEIRNYDATYTYNLHNCYFQVPDGLASAELLFVRPKIQITAIKNGAITYP